MKDQIGEALYSVIIGPKSRKSWWKRALARGIARFIAGVLVDQAMIIEASTGLWVGITKFTEVKIGPDRGNRVATLRFEGHVKDPGKAIAVILPLREVEEWLES